MGRWISYVRRDARVHASAFRLAHALDDLAGRSRSVSISQRRAMAASGLGREAFGVALGKLSLLGFIRVTGSVENLEIEILPVDPKALVRKSKESVAGIVSTRAERI